MAVYIFTEKESALKPFFSTGVQFLDAAIVKHNPDSADISYADVSGLTPDEIKKRLGRLKKYCTSSPWGIIDPEGNVRDPAALFFEGASDYMGPAFFKEAEAINSKRVKTAAQWRLTLSGNGEEKTLHGDPSGPHGLPKTGIKLPAASSFPGWKNMKTGKTMPFYLMYCAIQGNSPLNSRLGEEAYAFLHQRLLAYLFQNFQKGGGLIWMDSGADLLFLLPPKAKNAEAVITSCIRMLVFAPLVAMEIFGLAIPVNFVFALHYGVISYSPPGKTGTVISDAVNHVFHLGTKKAEAGRLTVTGELPDGSIPKTLEDCFVSAGEYEGRKIWHTKKFGYGNS